MDAIHRLNYQMRIAKKLAQEKDPDDIFHHIKRIHDVVKTLRRYKRCNKSVFAGRGYEPKCEVRELPLNSTAFEGHLEIAGSNRAYIWNVLPTVPRTG